MPNTSPTVCDLAAYILERRGGMGPLKLQKLVYYCQAWSVTWDGRPIFDEPIEAWKHGPVVRELWETHRTMPHVTRLPVGDPERLDAIQRATVDAVLEFYGGRSDWWLRQLSHAEIPWADADKNQIITVEELREFYGRYRTEPHEIPVEVIRGLAVLASLPEEAVGEMVGGGGAVEVDGLESWLETGEGDPWAASRD
jgi:uncharacterized phage-associated protein